MAASLLFSLGMQAQRNCGTPVPSAEWDNWFNQKVTEHKQAQQAGKAQSANFTIPVVVHVIYGSQAVGVYPNISQAQINSQIAVLNADYAGTGQNVGNLANTGFASIGAADCGVEFCLAQLDPDGNVMPEAGIDRVSYISNNYTNPGSITSLNTFQSYMDNTVKPGTIWDPTRYLNIWICDMNASINLLGYATFPAGSGLTGIFGAGNASNDGVVVYSRSFGKTGILNPPYHLGRTATHEIGHWLGLRHVTGDSPCGTDFCNDTPTQKALNFGCPTYPLNATGPSTCMNTPMLGDMFMNFMDYCDDACLYMFTPDQSTRITTAMTNGIYRNQLTASSATMCNVVAPVMPVALFTLPASACTDTVVPTNNQSSGSPTPSYAWSILPNPGGVFTPNNSATSPNIIFSANGSYTVTMVATNSAGTATTSKVINVSNCNDVGIRNNTRLQNGVTLSPNPSSGVVNIAVTSEIQNLDIMVHSYTGQFITSVSYKDIATSGARLDLSSYANGVYFITISNGGEKTVKRIVLNH